MPKSVRIYIYIYIGNKKLLDRLYNLQMTPKIDYSWASTGLTARPYRQNICS